MFEEIIAFFTKNIVNRKVNFAHKQMEFRFRNFTIYCVIGIPVLLAFTVNSLLNKQALLFFMLLLCSSSLALCWLLMCKCKAGIAAIRINCFFFTILAIYLTYLGGEEGAKILWVYTYPLIAVFLFGHREGFYWCLSILVPAQVFLWNFFSLNLPHHYPKAFALRFCISFGTIVLLAYFLERFRYLYENKLEVLNRQLKQEVYKRSRIEQVLAKSREEYRAVFSQATDGILILEGQGGILESNPHMEHLLGYPPGGLNQVNIYSLVDPEDLKKKPPQLTRMLEGETITVERRLITRLGHHIDLEITGRMLQDKERFVILCRDITEKKAAAAALNHAYAELKKLANMDGLTKVANRRKFDTYLQTEWNRARREQSSLALIICDIDFFKQYNDTYGHQQGDACLQDIAQALSQSVQRPADMVCRVGGEEFSIILPNTSFDGAMKCAETIRTNVNSLSIKHRKSTVAPHVTLSIGVCALLPAMHHSLSILITETDKALYVAKSQGRDRIVAAPRHIR